MTTNGRTDPGGVVHSYVREMLELNPMWQAQDILRRRREIFGAPPATIGSGATGSTSAVAESRKAARLQQRARRSLDLLRERFYELPRDQLVAHVKAIDHPELPQYATMARRFKAVAKHRLLLLKIQQDNPDVKFTYSLLQGLIAPAAEAAALREQYMEAIQAENRVKSARQAAREFARDYPQIVQLQPDWFDLLTQSKRKFSSGNAGGLSAGPGGFTRANAKYLWVVFIVLLAVAKGFYRANRGTSPSSAQPPAAEISPNSTAAISPQPTVETDTSSTRTLQSQMEAARARREKLDAQIRRRRQQQAEREAQEEEAFRRRMESLRRSMNVIKGEPQSSTGPTDGAETEGRLPGGGEFVPGRPQMPDWMVRPPGRR